ncbi:hypothetical protein B0H16DRAFT_1902473 [Mycena metata]|uniref:Peptidase S53 domain-containing protein n=1 Tax=Mycena metata TaxID=1033252 RepID=A0AAD7E0N3_9AGAR|nr:hypothetical protein B0H16DRAFT_1902473 [Mycena metata]
MVRAASSHKTLATKVPSTSKGLIKKPTKSAKAATALPQRTIKKEKVKGALLSKIKEPVPVDKEAKICNGVRRQMRRSVAEAKVNLDIFPNFQFLRAGTVVSDDPGPPRQQLKPDRDAVLPEVKWDDGKAHCARSADGVDMLIHIPAAMRNAAADELYKDIMGLMNVVDLKICAGADGATRNLAESFYQTPGGKAGVFKAVKLWHAIGHTHEDPTVAADVIKNGKTYNTVMELLPKLNHLSQRVNDALEAADPAHFAALQELRVATEKAFPSVKAWNSIDELQMEGREFMFNRETQDHRDLHDPQFGWAVLAALGHFQGGDLILLRGRVLKHKILPFTGQQRISVAHFTHQSLWDAFDVTPPQTIHPIQFYTRFNLWVHLTYPLPNEPNADTSIAKTTLGSSAILGIQKATRLTTNQYNWLGTIFYLSYLAFEFPQNLALQRFPVAKWMSLNIFIWAVALCTHAACTNFGGLFAVRLVLGMCEGSITAGFMLISSMFYTRKEQTLRVGYWFLMNGTAQIISGFISFGTLHIHTSRFEPWQWLFIITGILMLITSASFWFFFPASPTTAYFLTPWEHAIAVLRLKVRKSNGVENKHFKKEQMIAALLDPKTWLFALFSALDNVPNRQAACLQDLYGIPSTPATQRNNTLVVTGFSDFFAETADLSSFLKQFRPDIPSNTTFSLLSVDGGENPQGAGDGAVEPNLDIQYTLGIATGVPIQFLSAGVHNATFEDFAQDALDIVTFLEGAEDPPTVVSILYGSREDDFGQVFATKICDALQGLTARGVSVLVASGDEGARGATVNPNATDPCSENNFFPKFPAACPWTPEYQKTAVSGSLHALPTNFTGTFNKTGCAIPDVAMQGFNYEIVNNNHLRLVCSSSEFALAMASVSTSTVWARNLISMSLEPRYGPTELPAVTNTVCGSLPVATARLSCAPSGFANIAPSSSTGSRCAHGVCVPRLDDDKRIRFVQTRANIHGSLGDLST